MHGTKIVKQNNVYVNQFGPMATSLPSHLVLLFSVKHVERVCLKAASRGGGGASSNGS
jgi:S-adenosylmethionine hydrolase